MAQQEDLFKKVIAHSKEYGFVFPSSEIYDGLGAVYDYGQLGSELKTLLVGSNDPLGSQCRGDRLGDLYASQDLEGFGTRRRLQ